jgi:hypothetical protein
MSKVLLYATNEARTAVALLFGKALPILVEVRFPNAATSPDWHLLEDEEQFETLLGQLAPSAEFRLSSEWDLKNTQGEVRIRKGWHL